MKVINLVAVAGTFFTVLGIVLIIAQIRIFSIDATLKKILKKLDTMDKNRRDEFNAMTEAQ